MSVSVVIITHNEEKNIERTVHSLQNLTDDILIVDSFSSDRTPEICRNLPVRFIQHAWEGYAAQKNFGASQAKYDWILSIDADEVLSEDLVTAIKKVMQQPDQDAYALRRRTYYCGHLTRFGGWNPEWLFRLFNKNKIHWLSLSVHEITSVEPGHKTARLEGCLYHYSYTSVEQHRNKIDTYTTLFADQLYKEGKHSSALKVVFSPLFTFLKEYFLKLGILDGWVGLQLAYMNSTYTFQKYYKLMKKYNA